MEPPSSEKSDIFHHKTGVFANGWNMHGCPDHAITKRDLANFGKSPSPGAAAGQLCTRGLAGSQSGIGTAPDSASLVK